MIKHLKIALDSSQCLYGAKQGEWSQHFPLFVPHMFDIMANGTFLKSGQATLNLLLTSTPYGC